MIIGEQDKQIIKWLQLPEISDLLNENRFKELYNRYIDICSDPTWYLTQVLIKANIDPLPYIDSIPEMMFRDCAYLEEVTIPENIQSVGMEAFRHCFNLKRVAIKNTETEFNYYAFDGCFIEYVYYNGTQEDWTSHNMDRVFKDARVYFKEDTYQCQ